MERQTEGSMGGEVAVDWRGRPCKPTKHGGMRAAIFVLGIQGFEIMAIAAVGNNLITYVFSDMHFSLPRSANIVTNFVGTIFLLALLGGFLSDSYLGSFWTILIFGFVELTGFILLSLQAHLPQLRPPQCNMTAGGEQQCVEAKGIEAAILFLSLYLVALGSGCLKPNMISHGADQFGNDDSKQSKKLSTYFNAVYFSFCVGELIALTLLVFVQTRSGMDVGFGVSAGAMATGLISFISGTLLYRNSSPQGNIFTPVAQVFVAAFVKRKHAYPSRIRDGNGPTVTTERFRFLENACIKAADGQTKEGPWRACSAGQVQQAKILLSVLPIFACTIIFNTILAQLQTFTVQQGAAMNTRLTRRFHIPPASLQSIPYLILIFLVPAYEITLIPLMRRATGIPSGITPLHRIGVGLFTVTFSMVTAALVENKRRSAATGPGAERISIFWIAPQFIIFGVSEMFTAVGLIEFFYTQPSAGMQSFLTAITYCSYSFGFFLSSLLVSLVNKITSSSAGGGWLSDNDLNKDRLDLFYWMLGSLSVINFFVFLLCARWYNSQPPLNDSQNSFGS